MVNYFFLIFLLCGFSSHVNADKADKPDKVNAILNFQKIASQLDYYKKVETTIANYRNNLQAYQQKFQETLKKEQSDIMLIKDEETRNKRIASLQKKYQMFEQKMMKLQAAYEQAVQNFFIKVKDHVVNAVKALGYLNVFNDELLIVSNYIDISEEVANYINKNFQEIKIDLPKIN